MAQALRSIRIHKRQGPCHDEDGSFSFKCGRMGNRNGESNGTVQLHCCAEEKRRAKILMLTDFCREKRIFRKAHEYSDMNVLEFLARNFVCFV